MRYVATVGLLLALHATLQAQEGPTGRRGRWEEERPDTPLVNAKSAWLGGVTTFTRGDYQPSAVDARLGIRTRALVVRAVSVGLRVGSFVQNQAVLIGRTQGVFVAAVGGLHVPLVNVAAVGNENDLSYLKVEFLLEGAAALNLNTPMPQGRTSAIVAPLLVITFGGRGVLDQGFSIVAGPAYFMGSASEWHTQVSLRFQNPRR